MSASVPRYTLTMFPDLFSIRYARATTSVAGHNHRLVAALSRALRKSIRVGTLGVLSGTSVNEPRICAQMNDGSDTVDNSEGKQ